MAKKDLQQLRRSLIISHLQVREKLRIQKDVMGIHFTGINNVSQLCAEIRK